LRLTFRLTARGLFALQFPFPQTSVRLGFSAAYLAIAVILLVRRRADLLTLLRGALPARR